MACVVAKPGESFDSLVKRFKKAVERSGVLADVKKHEVYEKPSVKRKKKEAAAFKRFLKKQRKLEKYRDRANSNENFRFNEDRTKKIPTKPHKNNGQKGYQGNRNRSPVSPTPNNFRR